MRHATWISPLCLLLFLFTSTSALGRDIYVNNRIGDDRFSGKFEDIAPGGEGPMRTIAAALHLALHGDRIILAKTEQPYRESITFSGSNMSGSNIKPFILEGNGAILDGSEKILAKAWQPHDGAVFRFKPLRGGSQQLFLDGKPGDKIASSVDKPLPTLKPREWCEWRGSIYFCVEETKLPSDYDLSYAALTVGLTFLHVNDVIVSDLTVQGFQLDGINAANSASHVTLSGVTLRGNGRSGLTVGGASIVTLEASLVGNNGEAQLLTLPYSHTMIENCDLLPKSAPAWVDKGGEVQLDGKEIAGGRIEMKE